MANLKDLLVNGPSSFVGDVGISGRLTAQNSTINSLLTNGTYEAAKSQSEQRDGDSSAKTYYYPVKWKFNTNNFTIHNGDMITIKTPYTGHDYGIFLSLDNGSTYYPVIASNTVRLTGQYGAGQHIMLVFENTASAASIYPLEGAKARVTISGGAWRVINYYDSNTIPGYCSTEATKANKYVSCSGYVLKPNNYIPIIVTTTNTAKDLLKLNVNSTGEKPIYINNSISSSSNYDLPAGSYIVFYDGENYYFRTDGFLPGLNNIIRVCSGTAGSTGYIKIAQLKVLATYQNRPITIELAQRGSSTTTNISILFLNSNSTDPTLYKFIATGPCKNIFMNKSATSTWDLYVQKSESYDTIVIYKCLHSASADISITWTDSQISSAISGWTQATSRDIFHLSSVSHLSWDNATTNYYITKGALAYWNGAYLSPSAADPKSNLKYLQYASFSDNGHFIPKITETYNLGTSSYKWDQVYLNSIQFRGSSYTTDNYITSDAQNNIFFSVGGINSLVVENTDLRPGSGRDISLGTSSNKWYGLYTNSLQVPNSGTITSSLPIKITHASGGQKEFQIVYGDNIDFSLMVGTANSNHGLYDSKKGTNGTWILSADSTNHNWSFNGNASTATTANTAATTKALKTADITTGSDITSHADVIQQYFSANYNSVPRKSLLSFYSDKKSPGSQYFGYYIDNYNTNPCGSFFAMHYNDDPVYVGISGGTYTERTLLTDKYAYFDSSGNFLRRSNSSNGGYLGTQNNHWPALYANSVYTKDLKSNHTYTNSQDILQSNTGYTATIYNNYGNNSVEKQIRLYSVYIKFLVNGTPFYAAGYGIAPWFQKAANLAQDNSFKSYNTTISLTNKAFGATALPIQIKYQDGFTYIQITQFGTGFKIPAGGIKISMYVLEDL